MINPEAVFVGHARPTLATPTQRSAMVFGAAQPLGEAMLAQILATPLYQRVTVSTTAPLPATVAHLTGAQAHETLPFQPHLGAACHVDCVLVVDGGAADHQSTASGLRYGFATRSPVYAPLTAADVPALLARLSSHAMACQPPVAMRWLVVAPHTSTAVASGWVAAYSAHLPCTVYGLDNAAQALRKQAYRFKPEGATVLDRLGVWVLNLLSDAVHGMMNPNQSATLGSVKTAQRLVARFCLAVPAHGAGMAIAPLAVITPQDLAAG